MRAAGIFAAFVATILTAAASIADAPQRSLRPEPRPVQAGEVRQSIVPVRYDARIRPRPRPDARVSPKARPDRMIIIASAAGVTTSPRPVARPRPGERAVQRKVRRAPVIQTAALQRTPTPTQTGPSGAVCGDPAIRGRVLSPIAGRLRGCGVERPVKVTSIDGVALSQASIMNCQTAKALKTWINKGIRPAVGRFGGGVEKLQVAAHYSCRTRNNKKGAKISEHGKGKAIDISAIKLKSGEAITVLKDWKTRKQGKMLKRMHRSACGPFGTVLGPNADKYHRDHFHLDTARYRSGPYCR